MGRSGSGGFGRSEAHTDWFGHPSHADVLPASVDSVPCGEKRTTGERKARRRKEADREGEGGAARSAPTTDTRPRPQAEKTASAGHLPDSAQARLLVHQEHRQTWWALTDYPCELRRISQQAQLLVGATPDASSQVHLSFPLLMVTVGSCNRAPKSRGRSEHVMKTRQRRNKDKHKQQHRQRATIEETPQRDPESCHAKVRASLDKDLEDHHRSSDSNNSEGGEAGSGHVSRGPRDLLALGLQTTEMTWGRGSVDARNSDPRGRTGSRRDSGTYDLAEVGDGLSRVVGRVQGKDCDQGERAKVSACRRTNAGYMNVCSPMPRWQSSLDAEWI